jgi:hypothetical protein
VRELPQLMAIGKRFALLTANHRRTGEKGQSSPLTQAQEQLVVIS